MRCGFLPLILAGLFSSCGGPDESSADSVHVFAAASLTEVLRNLETTFEAENPDFELALHFAGSQTLATQIENGARIDLFISANRNWADRLREKGLLADQVVFVRNSMAAIVPASNPAGLTSLEDAAAGGVRVVIGSEQVPAGRYALEVLERLNLRQSIEKNVVSKEDSVKGVLGKIFLGEADLGIVYRTDTFGISDERIKVLTIPEHANVSAAYYMARSNESQGSPAADAFVRFLKSPHAREILRRYLFEVP